MKLLPQDYEQLRHEAGIGPFTAIGLLVGIWMVPGSLASLETFAMAQLGGRDVSFWRALGAQAPSWLTYGILSPLILHAAAKLPLHVGPRLPKLLAHSGLALICGIPYALTATLAYRTFMPMPRTMEFGQMALSWYLSALPIMILTYFAVIGGASAVHWFVRHRDSELNAARLEAQLSDARLGALRMQLHPHFLFNSLNAITVLVRDRDHHTAERMLELLGEVLRSTLRGGGEHRVSLENELAFIRRYLQIEEIRFSDRLRVRYEIEPGLEDALVPALVLQPLIENAIRHGISLSSSAGKIGITARRERSRLILEVSDDGPGIQSQVRESGHVETAREHSGVGLANTRSRLAVLYGDASCKLLTAPDGGTVARINMPLEWSQRVASEPVHA